MNVPNHAQSARIKTDLIKFFSGERPEAWQGNSYQAYTFDSQGYLTYVVQHWNTEIMRVWVDGATAVVTFRATYISTTTRGIQTRIARAVNLPEIDEELSKKTTDRGIIEFRHSVATGWFSK